MYGMCFDGVDCKLVELTNKTMRVSIRLPLVFDEMQCPTHLTDDRIKIWQKKCFNRWIQWYRLPLDIVYTIACNHARAIRSSRHKSTSIRSPLLYLDSECTDDPTDAKRLIERACKLNWNTRDEIIASLNRYSRVICGGVVGDEIEAFKAKLAEDNCGLYKVLTSNSSTGDSCDILYLDFDAPPKIVKTLTANQILINEGDSVSKARKQEMVEQNNKLIVELIQVPLKAGSANKFVLNTSSSSNRSTTRTRQSEKASRERSQLNKRKKMKCKSGLFFTFEYRVN